MEREKIARLITQRCFQKKKKTPLSRSGNRGTENMTKRRYQYEGLIHCLQPFNFTIFRT